MPSFFSQDKDLVDLAKDKYRSFEIELRSAINGLVLIHKLVKPIKVARS